MTDDPRVPIAMRTIHADEWSGKRFVAELDAVDPLRQPVSQDRVEAALSVWFGPTWFNRETANVHREVMARALAAADRVQAPAEKPDFPMRLLQLMSQWVLWESVSDPQHNEIRAAYAAAFPETKDAG